MNKRFLKRLVAFTLAATMVVGNSVIAFAESTTGRSTFEGIVPEYDVTTVTVPTAAEVGDKFDYIADPNGLLEQLKGTGADKNGYTIENDATTGIYFASGSTLMKASAPLEIENQTNVATTVDAEVQPATAGKGVVFATSSAFTGITAKQLYLQLQDAAHPTTTYDYIKPDGSSATIRINVAGSPNNFTTGFTTHSSADAAFGEYREYFVTPKAGALTWNKGSFQLTGNLNPNATWDDDKSLVFPKVTVTWSFNKAAKATMSITNNKITVSGLTADENVSSLWLVKGKESYNLISSPHNQTVEWDTANWSDKEGGTLGVTLKSDWNAWSGETVKVYAVLSNNLQIIDSFTMPTIA